ncbi:glycosyltransferase [Patescibacteria group bacterium]|nr:glycosyltransferase [Patescibacteria group bacterium]
MKKDKYKSFEDYNLEYGEEYYNVGCTRSHDIKYEISEPRWFSYFNNLSDQIISEVKPKTVMDVGCAKGFLVSLLRDKGVEAFGIEVSEYALSSVRNDIKKYCKQVSILEDGDIKSLGRYDLVTCIEVLEHLPDEFAEDAVSNLIKLSDNILFSSTPDDYEEESHVNIKSPQYWVALFNKFGYYIDPYVNIASIPHSMFFSKLEFIINKFLDRKDSKEKLQTMYGETLDIDQLKKENNIEIYKTLYELFFINKTAYEIDKYKHNILDKDTHIKNLETQLSVKDKNAKNLETQLSVKDKNIGEYISAVHYYRGVESRLQSEINILNTRLNNIFNSRLWKVYSLYARIKNLFIIKGNSYKKLMQDLENDKFSKFDEISVKEKLSKSKYKPLISIIMPVYKIDIKILKMTIQSVKNQIYKNWEICIVDDNSRSFSLFLYLLYLKFTNKNIKVSFSLRNMGIAETSNKCIKKAIGEYIALLDDDDLLTRNALAENILLLNLHKGADLIYSDEDKLDNKNKLVEQFFKPDWSKYRFLSNMYTSHLSLYRKSIIDEIEGFRSGFEGAQDYDLMLRFIEKTNNIYHIPKILYHWIKIEGSTSQKYDAKPIASQSSIKALKEYLERNKIKGEVLKDKYPGLFKINYEILDNPKVSIIIPTKDKVKYLKKCISSILKKTIYKNYEIFVVDNNSIEDPTFKYYKELEKYKNIKILYYKKKFNFSAINNFAVSKTNTDYILFLNNDMQVINKEWLSEMIQYIQKEDVGIVGAKLLYKNGTIQHAGLQIGYGGVAGHIYRFMKDGAIYFFDPQGVREVSGVTGACLLIKKDLFNKIGKFDDKNLKIAFNDVDLCLKVRKLGYKIIYTPYARLYHYESLSRGNSLDENEVKFMMKKWNKILKSDPYYNPNLPISSENPLDIFI